MRTQLIGNVLSMHHTVDRTSCTGEVSPRHEACLLIGMMNPSSSITCLAYLLVASCAMEVERTLPSESAQCDSQEASSGQALLLQMRQKMKELSFLSVDPHYLIGDREYFAYSAGYSWLYLAGAVPAQEGRADPAYGVAGLFGYGTIIDVGTGFGLVPLELRYELAHPSVKACDIWPEPKRGRFVSPKETLLSFADATDGSPMFYEADARAPEALQRLCLAGPCADLVLSNYSNLAYEAAYVRNDLVGSSFIPELRALHEQDPPAHDAMADAIANKALTQGFIAPDLSRSLEAIRDRLLKPGASLWVSGFANRVDALLFQAVAEKLDFVDIKVMSYQSQHAAVREQLEAEPSLFNQVLERELDDHLGWFRSQPLSKKHSLFTRDIRPFEGLRHFVTLRKAGGHDQRSSQVGAR